MRELAFIISVWLCASLANAGDYWPMQLGTRYHYVSSTGAVLVVEWVAIGGGVYSEVHQYGSDGSLHSTRRDHFIADASGDVLLQDWSYPSSPWPGSYSECAPPIKFVDSPLEIGKSWYTTGRVLRAVGPSPTYLQLYGIDRSETVTVPYGSFETLVMTETDGFGTTQRSGVYYLHRELGPVILPGGFELAAIEIVVGLEYTTWGAVKSLFR